MDTANLENLTDMVEVQYTAFNATSPNATGYVKQSRLQPVESGFDAEGDGEYTDDDKLPGWIFVETDDHDAYAVKESDMWTEVWPEKALCSGWGRAFPLGGTDDAKAPEALTDNDVYLINWCW